MFVAKVFVISDCRRITLSGLIHGAYGPLPFDNRNKQRMISALPFILSVLPIQTGIRNLSAAKVFFSAESNPPHLTF